MVSFKETLSLPAAKLPRDSLRSKAEGDLRNDPVGADDDDGRDSLEPEFHGRGITGVHKYGRQPLDALGSCSLTLNAWSPTLTAKRVTWSPSSFDNAAICFRVSVVFGAHVAQNASTTGLPFRPFRATCLPSRSSKVRAGAFFPTGDEDFACDRAA